MRTTPFRSLIFLGLLCACGNPERPLMKDEAAPRQNRDLTFRLSASDRAAISPRFDADALEEFLQMHPPEQRAALLKTFQAPAADTAPKAPHLGTEPVTDTQPMRDVTLLTRVSDPSLHEVLERVWAPAWAGLSFEELERVDPTRPGVKIALQRKRDLRRGAK